ncbi:hypothetical protein [Treponema sp. R8-4-B8]
MVNKGDYERKYISSDPCKFIQGGMIDRGLSDEFGIYGWEYDHNTDPNLEKLRND